jgi:glycine/D-amino acid oxidase-like deaminating enzyme
MDVAPNLASLSGRDIVVIGGGVGGLSTACYLADAGADVTLLDGNDDAFAGAVEDALTNAADEGVFVYGFAPFVETATDAIDAAGGDPDGANVESFG